MLLTYDSLSAAESMAENIRGNADNQRHVGLDLVGVRESSKSPPARKACWGAGTTGVWGSLGRPQRRTFWDTVRCAPVASRSPILVPAGARRSTDHVAVGPRIWTRPAVGRLLQSVAPYLLTCVRPLQLSVWLIACRVELPREQRQEWCAGRAQAVQGPNTSADPRTQVPTGRRL